MSRQIRVEVIAEQVVRQSAQILGPSSAASCAIREAEARRSRGESAAFYKHGNTILVGPERS